MPVRVTVVVRTKDRPDFLARALADISAQSFADWEVVVANDGGDRAVVDRAVGDSGSADDRVTVVDVPRPGGRCAAANAGIRAGSGLYVVLHDDDDLWHPDFLMRTVGWLDEHPDAAGVVTSTAIVYEARTAGEWHETARAPFWEGMQRISLSEMLERNRAVPISLLYRRSLHELVGWYDESLDTVEDWELLLRVLPSHDMGFLAGEPLALWTQRPDASGIDANSMFALRDQHRRDDAVVRDRELAAWVRANGIGLPLYISGVEQRIIAHIDATAQKLRDDIRAEIAAHQPIASRLRRLRRRLSRGR